MKDLKNFSFSKNILVATLIFLILATTYSLFAGEFKKIPEISFSELVAKIQASEVEKVAIQGSDLNVSLKDGGQATAKKESEAAFSEILLNYGVSREKIASLNIVIQEPSGFWFWMGTILPFALPFILIVVFFWLAARQVSRANVQAFTFGQSKARMVMPDDGKDRVSFKDVAGVKEAKEELMEIVDFLKNPKKFLDIGARIPKGVLLMGPPGSGKTLLARAVAGEAHVPFLHISGSEFVEMFVGVGASRVRDTFSLAKKSAPSIIFIDELDAIGRHRGAGLGGGHDEREQTLNQILVELDGFEPHEKVIVMAATNRPDILDPALLRPGRFDRRIVVDLPDLSGREEILKIHARKKPLAKDINWHTIAEHTPGLSGADLQNIVNEAAILAARENRKEVTQRDVLNSIEKVLLGPERKSHILSKKEKRISAYHEAGHALVATVLPHADPVHKVSIVSRGRAAGYTMKLPAEDRHLYSRAHFLAELAVSVGGYASEKEIFHEITTGASDDLRRASDMARALVTKYGMSEKIGPVAFGGDDELVFLGKELGHAKNYSEEVAALIDREVSRLMQDAFKTATKKIKEHKKALDAIADYLTEKETIERADFDNLIASVGLKVKKEQI
ncbi:MAG: ATP-dependent metallopeptidase FtsH/Yme1/Tma family protein [Candidatus Niyogibacteria bacterium]|nr:ATP-dependent metallopeptidase FtsH/Yme1/Tma family protein [Candidatus Niyogibacteria bacterium]